MHKVAIIEPKPSSVDFKRYFSFPYDRYYLTSDLTVKKVTKKVVDIQINVDEYDFVILVGSEPLKMFTKVTSVTEYSGTLVDQKYIPVISPSMLSFKPEVKPLWERSVYFIEEIVEKGAGIIAQVDESKFYGIQDTSKALKEILDAFNSTSDYITIDTETTSLYPRNGYILGISMSYESDRGCYIDTECVTEEVVEKFQELFNKKIVVFHNSKFDMAMLKYHYNFQFPRFEDTMLQHYCLDETRGSHGLKSLAIKFTKYGGYDRELQDFIKNYCKSRNVLKENFKWEWIPFDTMKVYSAKDAAVTFELYKIFTPKIDKYPKIKSVYEDILKKGTLFLLEMEGNGVPFNVPRLLERSTALQEKIMQLSNELYRDPNVVQFEKDKGDKFNLNSVIQLRKLLFDYIGLPPTGILTDTDENSTNKEALEILSHQHPIPALILELRKSLNIKNNYIDKILPQLDKDVKLRTSFNMHVTTSGRLSSSGKLNMQQLHRDDPTVKGCIMAPPGYKIINMDLKTAEMYYAAALSGDENLAKVFSSKEDFHSSMAIEVFGLKCKASEVKSLYPEERQAVKAISFGILYGAGPWKIAKEAGISKTEAEEIIAKYFKKFKKLKKWIDDNKDFIAKKKFTYSFFGRKRRLMNVDSDNKGVADHDIRSGLNFLVQSVSSDIGLLGAMDTHEELKAKGLSKECQIFALVHDSTVACVKDEYVDQYCEILTRNIQKDRGIGIPGSPIELEFTIAQDYSGGDYEKRFYPEFDEEELEPDSIPDFQSAEG